VTPHDRLIEPLGAEGRVPTPAAPAASGVAAYRRLALRRAAILAALLAALLVSVLADVVLGPSKLSVGGALRTIVVPQGATAIEHAIVWDIRLPMALMAVVVGAALAVAGVQMQTILNNPLAEPFTLGIAAAASFGAAASIVLGVSVLTVGGLFLTAANAWLCAMVACLAIQSLSLLRGATAETMILLGIALVFLFNALLSLIEYRASEQALQQVVFWTLGSLTKADWMRLGLVAAVLAVVVPMCTRAAWRLTALRMGDERAASIGVEVRRLRLTVLLGVSVLAATAVAFVGTIGFVGLVGPHVARMLVGEDQRYLLPASMLCGALLLSVTSIVSKIVIPGVVLPVGIITALVGVPFFVGLVFTRRRRIWG
jgi:iron complex transport system permease protein